MLLNEIFGDAPRGAEPVLMMDRLRAAVLDLLTPLAAHGVPSLTVQQAMDELNDLRTGLHIDRALLMDILDPQRMQVVKKVDGDRIHLSMPKPKGETGADEGEKESRKVRKTAQKQARKEIAR